MAQNSDMLREPSMDELLASIREIIEENSETPQQKTTDKSACVEENKENSSNSAQPSQVSSRYNQSLHKSSQGYNTITPSKNEGLSQTTNALNAKPMRPNPSSRNISYNNIFSDTSYSNSINANKDASAQSFDNPNAHEDMSMQDSMNALAERIGLRGNDTTTENPDYKNSSSTNSTEAVNTSAVSYNSDVNSSFPPVHNAPSHGFSKTLNNVYSNSQTENNEQYNTQQVNSGRPSGANTVHGAYNSSPSGFNVQEKKSNHQEDVEHIQDMNTASQVPNYTSDTASAQEVNNEQDIFNKEYDSSHESGVSDKKNVAYTESFDENFPGDVEHSTEDLLRPLIAKWLDENFRTLFAKVLREEVQRYIQKTMRRE